MKLTYELDTQQRPSIGLIVLQADETLENDMRRLLPQDLSCLVSRVPSGKVLTPDTLREMKAHITEAATLFPRTTQFSAVGYACTSGAAEIGADQVADLVKAGTKTLAVTDPVTALIAAARTLGISRFGLVSPYMKSVSQRLRDVLLCAGIETPSFGSFDEPLEENVTRITETSLIEAGLQVGRQNSCAAVFLSCTNLRSLNAISVLEAELGMPVLSSNQVLAWHLLGLSGMDQSSVIATTSR